MKKLTPTGSLQTLAVLQGIVLSFISILMCPSQAHAQTNPTAQALAYAMNFGSATFTSLQAGLVTWTVASSPRGTQANAESSTSNGDATITTATTTKTNGGSYGYANASNARFYIQTSSSSTNGTNQLACAINTRNFMSVKVSYDIEMLSANEKTIGVVLQYRVGTTGSWTTVSGSVYSHNSSDRSAGQVDNYVNLALPQGAEDNDVVQLRWATWRGSESGSSSGITIDNISITATPNPAAYYFRSEQSGNWNDTATWQMSGDSSTWVNATFVPSYKTRNITVLSGDTVTMTVTDTVDQLIINGVFINGNYTGNTLYIYNGAGSDFVINGTFEDNASTNVVWATNATWNFGANGTMIRTRGTSSNNWRDKYDNGISNIPYTANWILRKTGSDSPAISTVSGMYYPNLTIENNSSSVWVTGGYSAFTGSSDYPRIKGDFNIGGSGSNHVNFLCENTNSNAVLVDGDLIIGSGDTLRNYGTGFTIQGDLTVNGAIIYDSDDSRNLNFMGASSQTISGSGALHCYDLVINKTSNHLSLSKAFIIDHQLTLSAGNIITTATYLLTLADNATASGGSSSSFVSGSMSKTGNDVFTFPLGKNDNYQPLSISAPAQTTDKFTTEYFNSAPSDPDEYDGTIYNISDCEYWQLDRTVGSSNVTVKLGWNSSTCNSASPATMRIARWNTNQWQSQGACTYTGNSTAGTVTTVNSLTAFGTFALANACSIIANAGSDTTIYEGQSTQIGSDSIAGYSYEWTPDYGLNNTGIYNPVATPYLTQAYILSLSDSNNCVATDTVTINVINPTEGEFPPHSVTPNENEPLIFDRFGNTYSIADITHGSCTPGWQTGWPDATVGKFHLSYCYKPPQNNNTNPYTQSIINVINKVFDNVSNLLVWPNCGATTPAVYVQINAPDTMAYNTPGAASQFYIPELETFTNLTNENSGVLYGEVWRAINTGVNNPAYLDARIDINLYDLAWAFNTDLAANTTDIGLEIDLQTVLLHEVIHTLGFGSVILANGNSWFNPTTFYSKYDTYLYSDSIPLIDWDYEYSTQFNPLLSPAVALHDTCPNAIKFNGDYANNLSIANFDSGAVSHFGCLPQTNAQVMKPGIHSGQEFRTPTTDDINILRDLGYGIAGLWNYSPAFTSSATGVVGRNDGFYQNNINCTDRLILELCHPDTDSLVINFTDLLLNDISANAVTALQMIDTNGVFTTSANALTYKPSQPGVVHLRYIPVDTITGRVGNAAVIVIEIFPCNSLNGCYQPDLCNLICNPDCDDPGFIGPSHDEIHINPPPNWSIGTETPDIYAGSFTNPPNPFYLLLACNYDKSESVITNVDIISGKRYTLSYFRKSAVNSGTLDSLFIRLIHSDSMAGMPNADQQYFPDTLPPNQLIVVEKDVEPVGQQITICFTADNDYDRLWVYPQQLDSLNGTTWNALWLDRVVLVENATGAGPDKQLACGNVTVGLDACEADNPTFTWVNLTNYDTVGTTEQTLVSSNVTTNFEFIRSYPDNPETVAFPVTANNCTLRDTVTVTITSPLNLIMTGDTVVCTSDCNNTASVTAVQNGTPPYTYLWSDPQTQVSATASNLCPGVFTVTVTDSLTCIAVDTVTISINTLNLTVTGDTVLCVGSCNGTVSVTGVQNGIPPYTYLWNDPLEQTVATVDGLCPGDYMVTVTDSLSCFGIDTATISNPAPIIINMEFYGSCDNVYNDTAVAVASNGTPPYTFAWSSSNNTTDTENNLGPDTYSVTVTDDNDCTAADTFSLAPVDVQALVTNESCPNHCDGSIIVTVTAGPAPYTFHWADTTASISARDSLCQGTYYCTVTDAFGCTKPFKLNVNTGTLEESHTITGFCNATPNSGSIDLSITGGVPPYTYLWSNAATTQDIYNLTYASSFSVTVSDACPQSVPFTITISNPAAISVTGTVTDVTDYGGNNGEIDISVTGGYCPATCTYAWSNGASVQDAINLFADDYTVTFTDAYHCTATTNFTVTQPAQDTSYQLFIKDETADQGGEPYIGYAWMSPDIWNSHTSTGTVDEPIDLNQDNYLRVKIHNRGLSNYNPSIDTPLVARLYWTLARADERWTTFWDSTDQANKVEFGGNYYAQGGIIESLTIPTLNSGYDTILTTGDWSTTNPLYLGPGDTFPGTNYKMICYLARIAYANNGPYVNMYGELSDIGIYTNVRNLRKIVTRNSYIITASKGVITSPKPYIVLNNGEEQASEFSLAFDPVLEPGGSHFIDVGTVKVNMSPELYDNWVDNGAGGTGLKNLPTEHSVQFTTPKAQIAAIPVNQKGDEQYPFLVSFELPRNFNPLQPVTYSYNMRVMHQGDESTGFHFEIRITPPDSLESAITDSLMISDSLACDGAATVTAFGGTPPYTYHWCEATGYRTMATAAGLCAGAYSVTVTDANNATFVSYITLTEPSNQNKSAKIRTQKPNEVAFNIEPTQLAGAKPEFFVYPNPANNKLFVTWKNAGAITNLSFHNIYGEGLSEKENVNKDSGTLIFDLSKFSDGVYYIHIESDKISKTEKVVIFH